MFSPVESAKNVFLLSWKSEFRSQAHSFVVSSSFRFQAPSNNCHSGSGQETTTPLIGPQPCKLSESQNRVIGHDSALSTAAVTLNIVNREVKHNVYGKR